MALSYKSYDDYMRKLKNKNERISYSDYVKKELSAAEREYRGAVLNARSDALHNAPTYGSIAEELSGAGLSHGGYSEYLSDLAKSQYKNAIELADANFESQKNQAREGYKNYLLSYTENQEKLFSKVVADMSGSELADYDAMLDMASAAGLSYAYAKEAAKVSQSAVIARLRAKVINAINNDFYSEKESYEYAIKLGLGDDIARELSEYAKKIREIKLSGDYLDKIKNEINKEK